LNGHQTENSLGRHHSSTGALSVAMKFSWQLFGRIFLMISCIFLGLLIDLGWKEISSGYKRNFLNQAQDLPMDDVFLPKIQLRSQSEMIQEAEEEYRKLTSSSSRWVSYWNTTDAIVDSKPLSGSISVTEIPLVRIRANCSCQSPQQTLKQLFSPQGLHLLHSVTLRLSLSLPLCCIL
jgi:hypothetical protein